MSLSLIRTITASALALLLIQSPALAAPMDQQHKMHGKMDHSNMDHSQMNMEKPAEKMKGMMQTQPKEPGQGAFATIAEIVVLLTNDPKTDWSKVNIDALRNHLIDMDELVLRANSKMTASNDKIVFTVTGSGRTLKAIHTMVPAHSGVLTRTTDWKIKAKMTSDGAIMTITSDAPGALKKGQGSGLFWRHGNWCSPPAPPLCHGKRSHGSPRPCAQLIREDWIKPSCYEWAAQARAVHLHTFQLTVS